MKAVNWAVEKVDLTAALKVEPLDWLAEMMVEKWVALSVGPMVGLKAEMKADLMVVQMVEKMVGTMAEKMADTLVVGMVVLLAGHWAVQWAV